MSHVLVHERKPRIEYIIGPTRDGNIKLMSLDMNYPEKGKTFITQGNLEHCLGVLKTVSNN